MPNFKVLQDQPEKLKNQAYGFDGTVVRPLKTDNTGRPDIRPITNSTDSILVYGNDGTANQVLKTNSSGHIAVYTDGATALNITATDLDIRNLSNTQDNILIYGYDGTQNRAIKTDANGNLMSTTIRTFTEYSETGTTTDTYTGSTAQDVSTMATYTMFVKNTGTTNSATVKLQISPNNTDWLDDSAEVTLTPGSSTALSASTFLRYIRVAYKSTLLGQSTDLNIIFQGQS
ncbi:hypothetical protein ciss_00610 [Carboxydothermus islandicus]|uniref:DUF6385 domain-containing protein n=1 Tax=Carboxydothermus islandicus TaxID=661089 RepID=A0A1L8CYZ3_9THEO|nr:DUF6385 domain-containing protein [Carboxydothermus islandicus]GAV24128.1 hypothetical protein ciss_00610 [Carboxydothermus islandicus]